MAPTENNTEAPTSERIEEFSDLPLNYYSDQVPDIKPQLRKLDLQWLKETARENVTAISSIAMIGGAVALFLRRRPLLASCFVLGLVAQQAMRKRSEGSSLDPRTPEIQKIELERHALKAQLGDYGKLEVIPFR